MKIIQTENLLDGLRDWWLEKQDLLDKETYEEMMKVIAEEGAEPEVFGLFEMPLPTNLTVGIGPLYDWVLNFIPEILRVLAVRGHLGRPEERVVQAAIELAQRAGPGRFSDNKDHDEATE